MDDGRGLGVLNQSAQPRGTETGRQTERQTDREREQMVMAKVPVNEESHQLHAKPTGNPIFPGGNEHSKAQQDFIPSS